MLLPLMPLLSLVSSIILIIILEPIIKNKNYIYHISIVSLICIGIASIFSFNKVVLFLPDFIEKSLYFNNTATFFDLIIVISAILCVFLAKDFLEKHYFHLGEFYPILLTSVFGMFLINHSKNLLILFLGIEIMSICFYILSGFIRKDTKSIEAALKYFIMGSFATAFLLYGISYIYGATNSIEINNIAVSLQTDMIYKPIYFIIGTGLFFTGIAFKIALIPFHQWAPDVYTGSPSIVTGFMSTAGKATAFYAMILVFSPIFININKANFELAPNIRNLQLIFAVIAAITMLFGNITALAQNNLKRMLAYSSIAQAGYILMGIVAGSEAGIKAAGLYLTAYLFMQFGAFIVIAYLEKEKEIIEINFETIKGLSKNNPLLSFTMAVFMFSLIGLPPFAGFTGKYLLFKSVIENGYLWLAVTGIIASLISIYYYIKVIMNMYFYNESDCVKIQNSNSYLYASIFCTIVLIIIAIFPSSLLELIVF